MNYSRYMFFELGLLESNVEIDAYVIHGDWLDENLFQRMFYPIT